MYSLNHPRQVVAENDAHPAALLQVPVCMVVARDPGTAPESDAARALRRNPLAYFHNLLVSIQIFIGFAVLDLGRKDLLHQPAQSQQQRQGTDKPGGKSLIPAGK